jgi:hypothetical protein
VQGEQLAQAKTGEAGDEEEGRVLFVDPRPLPLGPPREPRMLVAAVFSVQARSGGLGDRSDVLGLEGLYRTRALFRSLRGAGHRVVS